MTIDEESNIMAPIEWDIVDISRELMLQVARSDREDHREIYDALAEE